MALRKTFTALTLAFTIFSTGWNIFPCYGGFTATAYEKHLEIGITGTISLTKTVKTQLECGILSKTFNNEGYTLTFLSGTGLTCTVYSLITGKVDRAGAKTYLTKQGMAKAYGYIIYKGNLMMTPPDGSLDFESAVQWCTDNNAEPFVPKDAADWGWMYAEGCLKKGYYHMWIPLTDKEVEGSFKWTDGTDASTPTFLTWYGNSASKDCVVAHRRTVVPEAHSHSCKSSADGIICEKLG